jgi:protein-tyrosine-phosphatase
VKLDPDQPAEPKPSILFVCTANRIRSVIAEGLMIGLLAEKGIDPDTWDIASAGTWATDGQPAFPEVISVMDERGLDLRSHRSQVINAKLLERYNLVLVMEPSHQEALNVEFPHCAGRIYLISEMAGLDEPVEDPIGGGLDDYETALEQIYDYLQAGFARIVLLANASA